jgi:hypothetical protein
VQPPPPPHVVAALAGRRPDFLAPIPLPQGLPPRLRVILAAGVLVGGAFGVWFVGFSAGEVTVSVAGSQPRPLDEGERLPVAGLVLLVTLAVSALLLLPALRALRDVGGWAAGTPEGLVVVTQRGSRVEPWTGFSDARREGRNVHLVARVGLRDPSGRLLEGGDDPEALRQACLARIHGLAPPAPA